MEDVKEKAATLEAATSGDTMVTEELEEKREEGDPFWSKWHRRARDVVMLCLGTLGAVNEMFWQPEPRPSMIIFSGALIGLPFMLGAEEHIRKQDKKETK